MKENNIPNIDAKLESASQKQVANFVRNLPEDTVSMAWRSALNEKLAPIAAQHQRKRRINWVWKPAMGLAMASALALVVVLRIGPSPAVVAPTMQGASVEASLVAYHRDSMVAFDVAGPGAANPEPTEVSGSKSSDSNMTEDDLSSL